MLARQVHTLSRWLSRAGPVDKNRLQAGEELVGILVPDLQGVHRLEENLWIDQKASAPLNLGFKYRVVTSAISNSLSASRLHQRYVFCKSEQCLL